MILWARFYYLIVHWILSSCSFCFDYFRRWRNVCHNSGEISQLYKIMHPSYMWCHSMWHLTTMLVVFIVKSILHQIICTNIPDAQKVKCMLRFSNSIVCAFSDDKKNTLPKFQVYKIKVNVACIKYRSFTWTTFSH